MGESFRRRLIAIFGAIIMSLLLVTQRASATEDRLCDGPSECCPKQLAPGLTEKVTVSLGVVVMGIGNINERAGTWDADVYLYEKWKPVEGFTPQTELVNEVERHGAEFDTTELRNGTCVRSRRMRTTLRARYNLRTFPFDHQTLPLEISDDQYDATQLAYSDTPCTMGTDDEVEKIASAWKLDMPSPLFAHEQRRFKWEDGAPAYDYATVRLEVRRHITYHLTKFFLPLAIIVALAFAVFWIDPDDLGSQATIGVTSLLAAIAFQFAEASALPEVNYLTLADRVYAASYVAIALAIFETLYSSARARRGDKTGALAVDRRCRIAFPVGLFIVIVAAGVRAFTET
jgi:hypothetical protein